MITLARAIDWTEKRLDEIAEIEREIVTPEAIRGGTKYVGLEHIDGSGEFLNVRTVANGDLASAKFRFSRQHILFGKLRPYLRKIARPEFEGVCSTDILPILPKPGTDRDFLFHYLRHPRVVEEATLRCEGANLPRLSPRQLESFPVLVPPKEAEQRRIAAILDKADAIHRRRREAARVTNQLIPSLFYDTFCKWLRIPQSEMAPLGEEELADIASGVTKGRQFGDQETVVVPYIRVANVQDGYLDLTEIKTIEVLPQDVESLRLERGDVLMTEGGDFDKLGRGAIWEHDVPDCIHQNHVFRVRCNRRKLLPLFFANYIRTTVARAYFLRCAKKTSNLASINMTQLRALPVPRVPIDQQKRFVTEAEEVRQMQRRDEKSIRDADDLFNALVQRAFRGEL